MHKVAKFRKWLKEITTAQEEVHKEEDGYWSTLSGPKLWSAPRHGLGRRKAE